jgi:hypothetical protein
VRENLVAEVELAEFARDITNAPIEPVKIPWSEP